MKNMLTSLLLVVLCVSGCSPEPKGMDGECVDIYGNPGRSDCVVKHVGYAAGYCKGHMQSSWVGYRLTKEKVELRVAERGENNFFRDPDCPDTAISLDFQKLKCDRGHLCPAADMHWDPEAMRESFYFTNISPQRHKFNAKVWLTLERYIRGFACSEGEIIVITGPILPREDNPRKDIGYRVTVPEKFYKVVYAVDSEKMIGFIVPHKEDLVNPKPYACTVDQIEEQTGLDFFSSLSIGVQDALESRFDMAAWKWVQID